MTWLETIGLKLVISWGIPMLTKLVPWVPQAIWDGITDILKHLAGLDDKASAASLFQQGTRAVIATTGVADPAKKF